MKVENKTDFVTSQSINKQIFNTASQKIKTPISKNAIVDTIDIRSVKPDKKVVLNLPSNQQAHLSYFAVTNKISANLITKNAEVL